MSRRPQLHIKSEGGGSPSSVRTHFRLLVLTVMGAVGVAFFSYVVIATGLSCSKAENQDRPLCAWLAGPDSSTIADVLIVVAYFAPLAIALAGIAGVVRRDRRPLALTFALLGLPIVVLGAVLIAT